MLPRRHGKLWTYEETLAVFALYMQMHTRDLSKEEDPDIIALASALERTPGSIAMKLQNVLAKDPNATRESYGNAAAMIAQMWQDFAVRGDEFVRETIAAYNRAMSGEMFGMPAMTVEYESRKGREALALTPKRLDQAYFRKSLLHLYDYRCCVTGLGLEQLLVASHIKPWAAAEPHSERVNAENGLLLNSLHDAAFDRGLITLDESYRLVMSKRIGNLVKSDGSEALRWLWSTRGRTIRLPKSHRPRIEFIKYHQDVVFLG